MNTQQPGAEKVRFVHISDTHFAQDTSFRRHGYESYSCARSLVEHINALPVQPDFVIHTGDVTTSPDRGAYELAEKTLSGIEAPVYYIVGNHDRAADIKRTLTMGPHTPLTDDEGLLTYRFDVKGIRFIGIDARAPDEMDPHGLIGDAQMEILTSELAANELPLVLFVHFPALTTGAGWIDDHALIINGDEFHRQLVPHVDRIRGVFYGHLHMPAQMVRDGVLYSCASSSFANFVVWPGSPNLEITDDRPGFSYVQVSAGQTMIRSHSFPRPEVSAP